MSNLFGQTVWLKGIIPTPSGGCRWVGALGGLRAFWSAVESPEDGPRWGEGREVRADPGNPRCYQRHPGGQGMEEAKITKGLRFQKLFEKVLELLHENL